MTTTTDRILELIAGPLELVAELDLSDADAAAAELERRYPVQGEAATELRAAMVAAFEAGAICDRGKGDVRYSRLSKPTPETENLSIDFVWMTGPGIHHRHPRGEVSLCFAVEGDPRFDGRPEGWVPYAPGSAHVPTVSGGHMLIVYFLPDGAVEWIDGGKS
jgi:hypothetical protein